MDPCLTLQLYTYYKNELNSSYLQLGVVQIIVGAALQHHERAVEGQCNYNCSQYNNESNAIMLMVMLILIRPHEYFETGTYKYMCWVIKNNGQIIEVVR